MSRRRKIPPSVEGLVRRRAGERCEYCHTSEHWQYIPFTIDHVVPLSKGGTDDPENLALACFHCNRRKANRLTAVDPVSGLEVSLFNPREDDWPFHFCWSANKLLILGLTPVGRATVNDLALNRERIISIRSADLVIGRHPPSNDPIQKVKNFFRKR